MIPLALWASTAFGGEPVTRAGILAQGIRPGAVVEVLVPFTERDRDEKTTQFAMAPTLSGWIHPGHYLPLQAHTHLVMREVNRGNRLLVESSVGLGATWVVNARKTYRLEGERLERVPLASRVVASPAFGVGVGRSGERTEGLVRARVGVWAPWQQSLALTWNLEAVLRIGGGR